MAVNVCDMSAELWQEDAYVHFRLRMDSEVSHCISTERDSIANTGNIAPRFPPNLHVVCIDDSPIARKALESILPQEIAGSVVQVFGETLADVAEYKRCVAEQCDIAIVDQNLSFPGAEVKGTDLIKEILAAGYGGLACVRSANCTDADQGSGRYPRAVRPGHFGCKNSHLIQWPLSWDVRLPCRGPSRRAAASARGGKNGRGQAEIASGETRGPSPLPHGHESTWPVLSPHGWVPSVSFFLAGCVVSLSLGAPQL